MRQFLKLVTSSCLGTILAFLTLFFILAIIGIVAEPQISTPNNSVLHLKFNKNVPELTNNVLSSPYDFEDNNTIGLNDIARLISKAKTDPNIKGILLQTEDSNISTSSALYISELLQGFKNSDKFIHSYGHYFTQSGYIIASTADSVIINPNGFIDLKGFGMVIPYMKNFSNKSKIKFDVYHAGKFKSAIEPYYRSSSSSENRYQTREYLNDYQDAVTELIANNRSLNKTEVEDIMINMTADHASNTIDLGLVDKIEYWEEYENRLANLIGRKSAELISLEEYYLQNPKIKKASPDRIAVLYAEGTIAHSEDNKGEVSMESYSQWLDKIEKNKKIKAVVLRVNSPGGSAFTSDLFWKRIEDIKASGKIIVASYGTYAASGGYYISCGADKIVSEPTTLTGSIGVFSMMPNLNEFFEEKIGINWDTIGTGEHTFIYSMMTPKSKANNIKLMNSTERIYDQFLNKVAEGRNMKVEEVHKIAQGRVWSGQDAVEIGLVDTLGNLTDAIAIAADLAEINDYKLLEYPIIKKTFYEELISGIMTGTNAKSLMPKSSTNEYINNLGNYLKQIEAACEGPQARLPFMITE